MANTIDVFWKTRNKFLEEKEQHQGCIDSIEFHVTEKTGKKVLVVWWNEFECASIENNKDVAQLPLQVQLDLINSLRTDHPLKQFVDESVQLVNT